jgi:hypothetical protein
MKMFTTDKLPVEIAVRAMLVAIERPQFKTDAVGVIKVVIEDETVSQSILNVLWHGLEKDGEVGVIEDYASVCNFFASTLLHCTSRDAFEAIADFAARIVAQATDDSFEKTRTELLHHISHGIARRKIEADGNSPLIREVNTDDNEDLLAALNEGAEMAVEAIRLATEIEKGLRDGSYWEEEETAPPAQPVAEADEWADLIGD